MKIIQNNNIPDSTYFTGADVEPILEDGKLTIYNGTGTHRSWGKPGVTSTVAFNSKRLTAVHVGFHHKHRGGQAWYYYVGGERRTWAQLDDSLRNLVLSNVRRAPTWAKTPGKLRAEQIKAKHEVRRGVKLVIATSHDRMISLWDSSVEYQIGVTLKEAARKNHGGGYYAYPNELILMSAVTSGHIGGLLDGVRRMFVCPVMALIEVETRGKYIEYGDKYAATYMKPLRVLKVFAVNSGTELIEIANADLNLATLNGESAEAQAGS